MVFRRPGSKTHLHFHILGDYFVCANHLYLEENKYSHNILVYKILLVFDRVGVGPLVLQQGVVFSALLLGFVLLLLSLHFIDDFFL